MHPRPAPSLSYRPEVDGLRAIAVLAVMLFHARVPQLPGGYLGVNIFFVISGYLITGILVQGEASGGLSLRQFYLRRVRRILPALLLTFALTTPLAYALLLPDGLENYGQSLLASALLANNLLLYLTGGYWDLAAEFKPLMHTWSLGVEEQYYLLGVPIILWLLRCGGPKLLTSGLATIAAVSLGAAVWLEASNPSLTFLILPTRGWELALGGLVALARTRGTAQSAQAPLLAVVGLIATLLPMGWYDWKLSAPGIATLIPAGGAALFLLCSDGTRGAGRMLAARLLVVIGLVSYSAYLFHQPLFALLRVTSLTEPSPWALAAWIPVILGAAWASWRWVERPARDSARIGDRTVLLACGGGTLLAVATGLLFHVNAGFVSRWVGRLGNIAYVDRVRRLASTKLEPVQRAHNVVVIGHSQARDFVNMALASDRLSEAQIRYIEVNSCGPALPFNPAELATQADWAVFSIGLNGVSARCLMGWAGQLKAAGVHHVLALGSKQFGYSNAAAMRLPVGQRYALRVPPRLLDLGADAEVRAVVPPGQFIDLFVLLSDARGSMPVFTPDRRFISQDGRHLTPAGARWLGADSVCPAATQRADQSALIITVPSHAIFGEIAEASDARFKPQPDFAG